MSLVLTQPQKLAYRVRVVPHLYILVLSLADVGVEFFPNTLPHIKHFWAWCVDNMVGHSFNGFMIDSDTITEF